jgi:prepilin-type N-terminal cleavage/methylation domain-containing protein
MTPREDDGFTLVETLVAFVIMAAVATMLYRGFSGGLRVSGVAEGAETALLVAKARLAALGVETSLQAGGQEGREGDVAWEIATRPYLAADGADRAARQSAFWATVTVSWRDPRAARTRSLQLTTLKLGRAE